MTDNKIDASPTKEFFITMLTRDIPLDRAILDLIDNSVDAANSNHLLVESNLNKPEISINFNEHKFEIFDNCGGIPLETAKNNAFRFGRPSRADPTPNSVGQFGVGMKRTLFKLGKEFVVQSRKNDEGFKVEVNVDQWKGDDDTHEWEFSYHDDDGVENNTTSIVVNSLYPQIAKLFMEEDFIISLMKQIALSHFKSLTQGVKITVNNKKVNPFPITFFDNEYISPLIFLKEYDGVSVKIIAGISERDLAKGGWYIVCNGRLIVAAEKSTITGWGVDDIRKYHPDFAFFRGIIEFNCENSSKLPWTTTKTGVDTDNQIFRKSLISMKDVMRIIMSYLKDRATEAKYFYEGRIKEAPLDKAISESRPTQIINSNVQRVIKIPKPNLKPTPAELTRIQYVVETSKFQRISASLGTEQKSEVGLKTFEYYFLYECGHE